MGDDDNLYRDKTITCKVSDLVIKLVKPVPYSYEAGVIMTDEKLNLWMLHELSGEDVIEISVKSNQNDRR